MTTASDFRAAYELAFQISPIFLTDGIASNIPGSTLPIILLFSGLMGTIQNGLSMGGFSLDDFPWRFLPVTGSSAINQTVATYPFANRQIAANATVEQPRSFSLHMISPVRAKGGYITKLPAFASLQSQINAHNNAGGTYTVITPSLVYTNCILLSITDATSGNQKQKQTEWKWDFIQPLITTADATNAIGGLMKKATSGSKITSNVQSSPSIGLNGVLQGGTSFSFPGIAGVNSIISGS